MSSQLRDPLCVKVDDLFRLLDSNEVELSEFLGCHRRRIKSMKKQKTISFGIADKMLSYEGKSYLLYWEIPVYTRKGNGIILHPDSILTAND